MEQPSSSAPSRPTRVDGSAVIAVILSVALMSGSVIGALRSDGYIDGRPLLEEAVAVTASSSYWFTSVYEGSHLFSAPQEVVPTDRAPLERLPEHMAEAVWKDIHRSSTDVTGSADGRYAIELRIRDVWSLRSEHGETGDVTEHHVRVVGSEIWASADGSKWLPVEEDPVFGYSWMPGSVVEDLLTRADHLPVADLGFQDTEAGRMRVVRFELAASDERPTEAIDTATRTWWAAEVFIDPATRLVRMMKTTMNHWALDDGDGSEGDGFRYVDQRTSKRTLTIDPDPAVRIDPPEQFVSPVDPDSWLDHIGADFGLRPSVEGV